MPEPFGEAEVERAFAEAGLELDLEPVMVDSEVPCEDEPQKLDRTCFRYVVSIDPSSPEPELAGFGGQDKTFWSVAVYVSEADAQEAASRPQHEDSLIPAGEGWRTDYAGNVAVLYNQETETLIKSALGRL